MYGFEMIDGFPVMEYTFEKNKALLGMYFMNSQSNEVYILPGFCMDANGDVLSRSAIKQGAKIDPKPSKQALELQIKSCIQYHNSYNKSNKANEMLILSFNENNGEIGMAIVVKGEWKPVFSNIGE